MRKPVLAQQMLTGTSFDLHRAFPTMTLVDATAYPVKTSGLVPGDQVQTAAANNPLARPSPEQRVPGRDSVLEPVRIRPRALPGRIGR